METHISGIPCWIEVDYIEPYTPAYTRGHPDNWEPACGGEIEFTVCDRRQRSAPWLERKMTYEDEQRIKSEILEQA